MRMRDWWLLVAGSSIAACSGASAQVLVDTLVTADQVAGDNLGSSIDVYGGFAIVGSPRDMGALGEGSMPGSAYVFRRTGSGWVEEQELTGSLSNGLDRFGISVGILGETAIVGAAFANPIAPPGPDSFPVRDAGEAYVFRRVVKDGEAAWVEEAHLVAPDAMRTQYFGVSVALAGDEAMVGASGDSENGVFAGAVYVFRRESGEGARGAWAFTQKLTASDGTSSDEFGRKIAVGDGVLFVGAQNADPQDAGAVYVFERDEFGVWSEAQKLAAPAGNDGFHFGRGLDLKNGIALIGTSGNGDGAPSGPATAFQKDLATGEWQATGLLVDALKDEFDFTGEHVALFDNIALVSSADFDSDPFILVYQRIADETLTGSWVQRDPLIIDGLVGFFDIEEVSCAPNGVFVGIKVPLSNKEDTEGAQLYRLPANTLLDITGDGQVNAHDLALLLSKWGVAELGPADIDRDGKVNARDLSRLLGGWGSLP